MSVSTRPALELIEQALEELPNWPVEKVVGQVIMASIGHDDDDRAFGSGGTDVTLQEIRQLHLGGICYFAAHPDSSTPEVIANQSRQLQEAAEVPLLICADQENGLVTRLREPSTRITSAMAQAAAGDWAQVESLAEVSGVELGSVGINMAAAPIADVNNTPENPVIGIRSASSSPQVVARYDVAVIEGLRRANVASSAKHFPGHGSTHVDSHVGLPTLDISLTSWWETEAIPFQACIEAGVDSIMVGHLTAPALDPTGAPATFSRAMTTGLLREQMGFEGVIITDALDMAGARLGQGPGAETIAALAAGADLALMPAQVSQAHAAVCAAVRAGRLDLQQLRASAGRVLALKLRLFSGLQSPQAAQSWRDVCGDPRHIAQSEEQIRSSITWRDSQVTMSLPPAPATILILGDDPAPEPKRGVAPVTKDLAQVLTEAGYTVEVADAGNYASEQKCHDATVLVTRDAWRRQSDAEAVKRLASLADVVVCARSPYDSALIPADRPVLLTFADVPGTPVAVANSLITGVASGKLPIDLLDAQGEIRWARQIEAETNERA